MGFVSLKIVSCQFRMRSEWDAVIQAKKAAEWEDGAGSDKL